MLILFVCTGNICRSVMAKYLLLSKLSPVAKEWLLVDSCGTGVCYHGIASKGAMDALAEWGLNVDDHLAKNIDGEILNRADLILTMSEGHRCIAERIMGERSAKVFLLSEFAKNLKEMNPKRGTFSLREDLESGEEIEDPFGKDEQLYRRIRDKIDGYIEAIVDKIPLK